MKYYKPNEPIPLKLKGAQWWHTEDYNSPNLSKASMGRFMYELLSEGAQVGEFFVLAPQYHRSLVQASVYMTKEMKENIESRTEFKFHEPPKMQLN